MKKLLFVPLIIVAMIGCNSSRNEPLENADITTIVDEKALTDTLPKIVKTADARFRVKDVQQTKEDLSSLLTKQGGTVAEFSISSQITDTKKVKYSLDSLKEITAYRKDGLLIAKVPAEKLDDFTNSIARMAVFVDQQAMKMDDQSIAYLTNKWKADNRLGTVAQLNKAASKKTTDIEQSLKVKDDYVDKRVENITIENNVRYSTITLNFYQDQTIKTLIVANDNLNAYQSNFFNRLWLNLLDGWMIFTELVLAIAKFWALFLAGFVCYLGYKHYAKKKKLEI